MPRRPTGRNRGTGSRSTGFLSALIDAVVTETRTKRAPRQEARQESRLPADEPTRIGGVRLGLRRQGEAFADYGAGLFGQGSTLSADQARSDVDAAIARRMRALGIEPVAVANEVDPQREAGDFARRLSWELRIPGQHYSGVSNQRLLEFRQNEDRDFAADTSELRAHVEAAVKADIGAQWDDDRAARIASDAILAWIVKRIEEQGVDVSLRPLSPAYRAHKIHEGLDGRIGIATGAWLRAVRRADVSVTA